MKFFSEMEHIFHRQNIVITERLDTVEASFSIVLNELPTVGAVLKLLNLVPNRDTYRLTLVNDSEDMITINNHHSELVSFSTLTDGMLPQDNIDIKIQINKTVTDGKYSIYNYKSFTADLFDRPLTEIMRWFSKHLKGQESLLFIVFDCDVSFSTRTLAFESNEDATFKPMVCRTSRLKECRDTAYFYDMSSYELVPDDFIILGIVKLYPVKRTRERVAFKPTSPVYGR